MRPSRFSLVLALLAAGAAGCGGGGSSTAPQQQTPPPVTTPPTSTSTSITVANNSFGPASTSVPVGSTVTWNWDSCGDNGYGQTTCVMHSVVFDDGSTSGGAQDGGSWQRAFSTVGTYKYHCGVHGAAMSGEVVVH